jgi:hypothetical protein
MQRHEYSFEVEATPEEIWAVFHGPKPKVIEHGEVRIEILHPGDDAGDGLVRHCHFRVPKYLLSGGRARSWEWLTELDPPRRWRYDAIGKPLWSEATGVTELEDLGEGRTRVHFTETYHVFNPVMRALLERRVHRFISRDNDQLMKAAVEGGVAHARKRAAAAAAEGTT